MVSNDFIRRDTMVISACWCTFLTRCSCVPQTKEALFTILGDLRPGDHFNFISFSNRVKVWQPGRLVPVTPDNVRDAKKFIFMLPTSGGETLATVLQLQSNII